MGKVNANLRLELTNALEERTIQQAAHDQVLMEWQTSMDERAAEIDALRNQVSHCNIS